MNAAIEIRTLSKIAQELEVALNVSSCDDGDDFEVWNKLDNLTFFEHPSEHQGCLGSGIENVRAFLSYIDNTHYNLTCASVPLVNELRAISAEHA